MYWNSELVLNHLCVKLALVSSMVIYHLATYQITTNDIFYSIRGRCDEVSANHHTTTQTSLPTHQMVEPVVPIVTQLALD